MNPPREALEAAWEKGAVDHFVVRAVLARVPPSWTLIQKAEDGAAFKRGNIQVIISVARQQDGEIGSTFRPAGGARHAIIFCPPGKT
jgi:hypothetical protein